jgi:hypothetical protein
MAKEGKEKKRNLELSMRSRSGKRRERENNKVLEETTFFCQKKKFIQKINFDFQTNARRRKKWQKEKMKQTTRAKITHQHHHEDFILQWNEK